MMEGWANGEWGTSGSGRRVRFYKLTKDGVKQLRRELAEYELATAAIQAILRIP